MLQKIQKHVQGWIAGVIVFLLALTFGLWGIENYIGGNSGDGATVAKVNGLKISTKTLMDSFHQMQVQQQQQQGGRPLSDEQSLRLKQMALADLISSNVMMQAAKKSGLTVSLGQAQQLLMSLPQLQVNGKFSPQLFQRLLQGKQMTEQQLMQQIQSSMLMSQLQNGLSQTAFTLPSNVQFAYEVQHQTRDLGYFLIQQKDFLDQTVPSDALIKAYYKGHQDQFRTPEQVSIKYIILSPEKIKAGIKYTAVQLMQYYNDNIALYSTPKVWKISKITFINQSNNDLGDQAALKNAQSFAAKIANGVPFAAAVKQDNMVAADQEFQTGKTPPAVLQMASQMTVGQVSQPFKTDAGYEIFEINKVVAAKPKPYSDVKDKVHDSYVQQQAQAQYSKLSDTMSNLTYTNPSSLAQAARAIGVDVQTTPMFSKAGLKTGLLSQQNILASVFAPDVLQQGDNSNPIAMKDGTVVVLRLNKHQLSTVKPFAEVMPQIAKQLNDSQASEKAGELATQIANKLNQGVSPQAVAKQFNQAWTLKPGVSRTDKNIDVNLIKVAFIQAPALKGASNAKVQPLINGDSVVMEVLALNNGDYSKAPLKERISLQDNLAAMNGQQDYLYFQQDQLRAAKIKILNVKLQGAVKYLH